MPPLLILKPLCGTANLMDKHVAYHQALDLFGSSPNVIKYICIYLNSTNNVFNGIRLGLDFVVVVVLFLLFNLINV